jgi:hypothetical protein
MHWDSCTKNATHQGRQRLALVSRSDCNGALCFVIGTTVGAIARSTRATLLLRASYLSTSPALCACHACVTDAYTVPQADDLYEPLCRGRGARVSQIRPKDRVRAVPKCLSQ